MADKMDVIITLGLIIMAAVAAYLVLTPNHMYVG